MNFREKLIWGKNQFEGKVDLRGKWVVVLRDRPMELPVVDYIERLSVANIRRQSLLTKAITE
jgi:hypothetical protein